MEESRGDGRDVAGHNLFGPIGAVESAIAQFAIAIVSHGPQAAVALEKQGVVAATGNRRDIAGHNPFGQVGVVDGAIAQFTIAVVAHHPQAAAAFQK